MNNSFDWSDYIRSDYVRRKSGESFSEVLARYLDDVQISTGVRQQELSNVSGLSSALIAYYKTGKRKPSLDSLVLLCIAMKLTLDRSEYLLYSVGYILNDSEEHRIYRLFLSGCAFDDRYSVENCKLMLSEHGYDIE